jgi:hypothetical protein
MSQETQGRSRMRDVLVVSVCAVIVLVMLLPAIEVSQTSARKMYSANNLKLLGLGVLN